jgi:undecaprenyl-diphosphatase
MATFAVAIVLAVRFPKVRWLMILVALAVSVSRLFRGSHFLTDIVAGAVLGVLIGAVVAHPWKDRAAVLASALRSVAPLFAGVLAVMSAVVQGPSEAGTSMILSEGGLLLAAAAMIAYVLSGLRPVLLPGPLTRTGVLGAMGLGIAMASGSLWVAAVMVLLWLSHWLRPEQTTDGTEAARVWSSETAFGLAVLLTLLTMMELRGALPIG